MKRQGLIFISTITVLALISGCAHRLEFKEATALTTGLHSIKATAIVEFTHKSTEKGRAVIVASTPDSFRIAIKGPLGTTGALIIGNAKGLTFVRRGESTSYSPDDPRIPFNIRAPELVSLLLDNKNLSAEGNVSFTREDINGGKSVTKNRDGIVLYRALMTDYRQIDGFSIPFTISIGGGGYKLLIKYLRVSINPEIKANLFKTKS